MEKIDLTPALKRPMDPTQCGQDKAALNGLVNLLNNPAITGAEVPPGENTRVLAVPPAAPAPAPVLKPRNVSRVFYTGRLCVGKDFVAAATGATIIGMADPIYWLTSVLTGVEISATAGKNVPGIREMMQIIGQWGRGTVSAQYPWTVARAMFVPQVQRLAEALDPDNKQKVNWADFGKSENIWLDALASRVKDIPTDQRLAVTNVRFDNEYKFFRALGWQHYHVMCGPASWAERLAKQKLTPESPVLKDVSEQLAITLDQQVTKTISQAPRGESLRVVWNDSRATPISPRLLTLARFVAEANTATQPAAVVATGE